MADADQSERLVQFEPTAIGEIECDASLVESHSRSANVTQFPIETGSNVADHIALQPQTIRLEIILAQYPFEIQVEKKSPEARSYEGENAARKKWDKLVSYWRERELVRVRTVLREYENMAILSLTTDQDVTTGESIRATVELQEVQIVQSEITEVPADSPAARSDKGHKPTQQSTPKAEENTSGIIDIFGG